MAVTGRFAPSPSGRIHLGNILCCLLAWLSARQKGGRVILRIEDLDIARCPRRSVEQVKEFQRRFTQQFHLLNCRELLAERGLQATPTAQAVGADDHCGTLIVSAVELLCDYLAELDGQK